MSATIQSVRPAPAILFRVADPTCPAYSRLVQTLGGTVAFVPRPRRGPDDFGTAHEGPFWALDLATGSAQFVPEGQSTFEEMAEGRPVRVRNDGTSLVVACEQEQDTVLGVRPCWLCRGTGLRAARWHTGRGRLVGPTAALHPFRIRTKRTEVALLDAGHRWDWEQACEALRANPGVPPSSDHGCGERGLFQLGYGDDGRTGLLYCPDCSAVLVAWDDDWVVPGDLAARFSRGARTGPAW